MKVSVMVLLMVIIMVYSEEPEDDGEDGGEGESGECLDPTSNPSQIIFTQADGNWGKYSRFENIVPTKAPWFVYKVRTILQCAIQCFNTTSCNVFSINTINENVVGILGKGNILCGVFKRWCMMRNVTDATLQWDPFTTLHLNDEAPTLYLAGPYRLDPPPDVFDVLNITYLCRTSGCEGEGDGESDDDGK